MTCSKTILFPNSLGESVVVDGNERNEEADRRIDGSRGRICSNSTIEMIDRRLESVSRHTAYYNKKQFADTRNSQYYYIIAAAAAVGWQNNNQIRFAGGVRGWGARSDTNAFRMFGVGRGGGGEKTARVIGFPPPVGPHVTAGTFYRMVHGVRGRGRISITLINHYYDVRSSGLSYFYRPIIILYLPLAQTGRMDPVQNVPTDGDDIRMIILLYNNIIFPSLTNTRRTQIPSLLLLK